VTRIGNTSITVHVDVEAEHWRAPGKGVKVTRPTSFTSRRRRTPADADPEALRSVLVGRGAGAPDGLDPRVALLSRETALLRRPRRPRRPPPFRDDEGAGDESLHLLARVLEVPEAIPALLRRDPEPARGVDPPPGQRQKPSPGGGVEPFDPRKVHQEQDLRRDLVDVLSAGPLDRTAWTSRAPGRTRTPGTTSIGSGIPKSYGTIPVALAAVSSTRDGQPPRLLDRQGLRLPDLRLAEDRLQMFFEAGRKGARAAGREAATRNEGAEGKDGHRRGRPPRNRPFLEELAKALKTSLGTGGTAGDGFVEIQGDHRDRLRTLLAGRGFSVKG